MSEIFNKHGWWLMIITGLLGILTYNYFVIMLTRILLLFGFGWMLAKAIDWIEAQVKKIHPQEQLKITHHKSIQKAL